MLNVRATFGTITRKWKSATLTVIGPPLANTMIMKRRTESNAERKGVFPLSLFWEIFRRFTSKQTLDKVLSLCYIINVKRKRKVAVVIRGCGLRVHTNRHSPSQAKRKASTLYGQLNRNLIERRKFNGIASPTLKSIGTPLAQNGFPLEVSKTSREKIFKTY